MPRPAKGEGERPKFIRKGSQALLATLIIATPFCMAQVALASTSSSSFVRPSATSSIGGTQSLGLLGTQRTNQGLLLATGLPNLGGKQSPFRLLTSDDISTLESTLQSYKSQLATLKATTPKNPANASALDIAIKNVETKISSLEDAIKEAKTAYASQLDAQETLKRVLAQYNSAVEAEKQAKLRAETNAANYLVVQQALQQAQATYDASLTRLNEAISAKDSAQEAYNLADASLTRQIGITNEALTNLNAKKSNRSSAEQALISAQQDYNNAVSDLSVKLQTKEDALSLLQQAQSNYDNNLIPDPTWIAPTYQKENIRTVENTRTVEVRTQVPTTTTTLQEQVIPNLLFNSDFSRGTEGWSGVNAGWQGSNPALIDGEIIFSYQNQTVSQGLFSGPFQNATLTLSADWFNNDSNTGRIDNYSMTVEAKDINQNTVGSATYNSTGAHDWENKSVTLTATGPVSYVTVSFSGIDNGFWYGIYGPHFKNPTLQISHGQMVTETTYEEVITYEEETYYTYETYYTTELVTTEGTINVKINEGGQATFNAPEGAVFVSSNLRYEAKDRPTCGKDIQPNINGLSTITIQALNSVWGDPCGGWQKHITGTLTYLGQPTAPLINDPALLAPLQEAQSTYDNASEIYNVTLSEVETKTNLLSSAQGSRDLAISEEESAQLVYDSAIVEQNNANQVKAEADSNLSVKVTEQSSVQSSHETVNTQLTEATTTEATTKQVVTEATEAHVQAQSVSQATLASKLEAETKVQASESVTQEAYVKADAERKLVSFTDVETIIEEPAPTPPEEEGSKEIPAELSAENLMEVNLEEVDPTELTEAQAEQLVEAALETFLTAEEGSPEYEQALDALYLAAEQDDIELPEELAAIPGLAGAVEVLNFLGNAGADMSPKVREESEKVVVTAVVAVGAAVASATGAATAAATTSSAGSSSGSSRRIGK
jgi:tetratricopeptide (TPR) repeat protein